MVDIARLGLEVDSRQVKAAKRDLDDFSRGAKGAENAAGGLKGAASGLAGTFAGAGLAARTLAGGLGVGAGLAGGLGVAGGILATIAVIPSAISAFKRFEEQMFVMEAIIKTTGSAAGQTTADIERMAAQIGDVRAVRDAAAMLLTFKRVSGETFERALKLADDLAAVGFGSMSSAAVMMGKALEDPIMGLTALRRVGVTFSQTQQEVIKNFARTGEVAKAQQLMLKGVEDQVGGAGAAKDRGLSGAFESLSDAQDKMLVGWSKMVGLGPAVSAILLNIAGAMKAVTPSDDPAAKLAATIEKIANLQRMIQSVPAQGGREGVQAEIARLQAQAEALQKEADIAARASATAKSLAAESQAKQDKEGLIIAGRMLLEQEAKRLGLLGELSGIQGQVRQKEIELTQANQESTVVTQKQSNAILDYIRLRGEMARTDERISLGIAGAKEIEAQAHRRATDALVRGVIVGGAELQRYTALQLKDAEATRERIAVMNSLTPALTQLSIDADKLAVNLDRNLASAASGMTTTLLEMAKGTKTAAEGLREMAMAMLEAIAKALILKAIVGPIAGLLGGGLGAAGGLFTGASTATQTATLAARTAAAPTSLSLPALGAIPSSIRTPASATAAPNVTVNVHGAPAGVERQQTRRGPHGDVSVDVWLEQKVEGIVMRDVDRGGRISRSLQGKFGMRPLLGG